MNRRTFIHRAAAGSAVCLAGGRSVRTEHLILFVTGGTRKKEYYEAPSISPNIGRLAREGFVFEEDHCETVASHDQAFKELLQGRKFEAGSRAYPTLFDYVPDSVRVRSLSSIPSVMLERRPRILVCRKSAADAGHRSYAEYLRAVKATDREIGRILDWIWSDPHFRSNTAIVIRPEFGRDDELNAQGELHHSYGFYYTHRVASIFWGPDFNRGVDRSTVIHSTDLAPTLAKVFGVGAVHAEGRVVPGLFRTYI